MIDFEDWEDETPKWFRPEAPPRAKGPVVDFVFWIMAGLLAVVGFWSVAIVLMSCAPAAENVYEHDQKDCVRKAHTLEESRACRADVDRAWHVDAGGSEQ